MIGDYICIYICVCVCVCVCGHIIIYECFVTSMLLTCIFLLLLLLDFPRKQLKHLTGILVYCICCLFWGRAMQTQCQAAFACILPSPRAPPGEKREGVGSGPWDNVQRACPAVHAPPPGGRGRLDTTTLNHAWVRPFCTCTRLQTNDAKTEAVSFRTY